MATAFEQILELKHRKEERAQGEARARRLALEQAARAVEQRRIEAETFTRELILRQGRLYDQLEARVCARSDIEEVREEIARMRDHESTLCQKIDEADAARVKAAEALDTARRAHLQAVKNVEKFRQLVAVEQAQAALAEQASEDKEMEEFIRLGETEDT
jgi:type III secretion protein O